MTFQATRLSLSPELRVFVARKLRDSLRAVGDLDLTSVHLAVELEQTNAFDPGGAAAQPLVRAEVNVTLPGRLLRAEAFGPDVQQATVALKHTLTRELRRWHDRMVDANRKGARRAKALLAAAPLDEPEAGWDADVSADAWDADPTPKMVLAASPATVPDDQDDLENQDDIHDYI